MIISLNQFKGIFPSNKSPEVWINALETLQQHGVEQKEQVAAFCQQIGHESHDMTVLEENLNYSADGLLRVFPKYFDELTAKALARKPEDIANVVYANRMGNGSTSQGDGWKFRGRGVLQITGKFNYTDCSNALYGDNTLLENPDLLKDPSVQIKAALWFWKKNGLKDIRDITLIQKKVNGGTVGLEDRISRYERAMRVL